MLLVTFFLFDKNQLEFNDQELLQLPPLKSRFPVSQFVYLFVCWQDDAKITGWVGIIISLSCGWKLDPDPVQCCENCPKLAF